MDDMQCAVVVAAMLVEEARRQDEARMLERRSKRKRRMWTREWLQRRSEFSHMQLIRELQEKDPHDFRNYLRMSEESFKMLLERVTPLIQRKDTKMRAAVPPDERLAVTLRFLATGRSLQDLHFSAAVSRSLLSVIIPETCNAIVRSLRSDNQFPKTVEAWNKIAKDFEQLWQFPNCGGALDGKHVRITQPRNSGSYFYNYKGYFSLIMMALVNANYEFINVDVGMNGRVSDGGVLEHTAFGEHLQNGALHLPPNSETTGNLNFVFVGDEAFPLHANLLKPFPQNALTQERRIFNYRLSRARRVVENAFGIMANRFRLFHTPINLKLQSIDSVVLACCTLHNFLRRQDVNAYSPPGFVDSVEPTNGEVVLGEWRANAPTIAGLQPVIHGRNKDDAKACRENYCQYFNGPGAVSWQQQML
ncbi:putative nuclease HARBI1 [Anomaloglossus baeobatrachus]